MTLAVESLSLDLKLNSGEYFSLLNKNKALRVYRAKLNYSFPLNTPFILFTSSFLLESPEKTELLLNGAFKDI